MMREKWMCVVIVDSTAIYPILKPLKLCTVGIDAFLVASGRSITTTSSLLPPFPELFVLLALRAASLSWLSLAAVAAAVAATVLAVVAAIAVAVIVTVVAAV